MGNLKANYDLKMCFKKFYIYIFPPPHGQQKYYRCLAYLFARELQSKTTIIFNYLGTRVDKIN